MGLTSGKMHRRARWFAEVPLWARQLYELAKSAEADAQRGMPTAVFSLPLPPPRLLPCHRKQLLDIASLQLANLIDELLVQAVLWESE